MRGWIKVQSYTDPPENILNYSPWVVAEPESVAAKEYRVLGGRHQGQFIVARLEGVNDREQAALLRKSAISVPRTRFPPLRPNQYYWADLIGVEVRSQTGFVLGRVTNMMATGANDVMEVRGDREHLIPFVIGDFVKEVKLESRLIVVDWDPDF